LVVAEAARIVL
jgi:hypothetical protein